MKRMVTDKEVVKVVNKAIEEGEIKAGGLPEYSSENDGQVLKVVGDTETGEATVEWGEAGDSGYTNVFPVKTDNTFEYDTNGTLILSNKDMTKTFIQSSKSTYGSLILGEPGTYISGDKSIYRDFKYSMLLGDLLPQTNNGTLLINPRAVGSIIIKPQGDQSAYNMPDNITLQNSLTIGRVNYNSLYTGQILFNSSFIVSKSNTTLSLNNSHEQIIALGDYNEYVGSSTWPKAVMGAILLGIGNKIAFPSNSSESFVRGIVVVGKYGTYDNDNMSDQFMVGAGTSTSARTNCFATGNDGTEDYIKIGDTKITETQLQALLASLA